MFYLLPIIPDNRFAFFCSIFNTVSEQSCSLVSGGGREGSEGLPAVVQSQVKAGGAQHPRRASVPAASSPASRPVGTRSPAGARLGSGCRCARQDLQAPVWALPWDSNAAQHRRCLEGLSSAAGSKRICRGCRMPDGFTCLNYLPAASRTLRSISGEGCHATVAGAPLLLLFPLAA